MSTNDMVQQYDVVLRIDYLHCSNCGKRVSSGYLPLQNELGDTLVVRAWIECPECIENKPKRILEIYENKNETHPNRTK